MTQICNTNLPNFGSGDCKLAMGEIKRVLFTSVKKEDGTKNHISKTNAATLSNWTDLFNKKTHDSDKLEKVVPTSLIYQLAVEQGDPEEYDEGGYYAKLRDGDYTINFMVIAKVAYYIKQLKQIENNNVAVYLLDNNNKVWGQESGDDLYPIEMQNVNVPNFNLKTREAPSQELVGMRVKNPETMNDMYSVTISDADHTNDSDFYSMDDISGTVASPAVTGCQVTLEDDKFGEAVTGLATPGSDDYLKWVFYDDVAPTVAINLAADTSISEGSDGVYTINEATLLTSGHTYKLKLSADRYDIAAMTVTVP